MLIDLLALENGEIKPEVAFEVDMVPGELCYYAGLARSERGASGAPRPDITPLVLCEPMGVADITVPWNSPVVLMIRSLALAPAAGITAVVKMPGQTAQTNALVMWITAEAPSLSTGTANILSESDSEGARRLTDAVEVSVISFTNSSVIGRMTSAVNARHLKRFGLELGGRTPHLVFDDADLDTALSVLEKSLMVFVGQFYMISSHLLIQHGVAERLRKRLAQRLGSLCVRPAAGPRNNVGPLIDKANAECVE